jgi:hypothetical protein
MACATATLTDWLDIIRGEFVEMPGLVLTPSQFQRLWGLDVRTCDEAIDALLRSHFLIRRADGKYARAQSVA